jgi:hypothetical protein
VSCCRVSTRPLCKLRPHGVVRQDPVLATPANADAISWFHNP